MPIGTAPLPIEEHNHDPKVVKGSRIPRWSRLVIGLVASCSILVLLKLSQNSGNLQDFSTSTSNRTATIQFKNAEVVPGETESTIYTAGQHRTGTPTNLTNSINATLIPYLSSPIDQSHTISPTQSPTTQSDAPTVRHTPSDSCCFHGHEDLNVKLTREFFMEQAKKFSNVPWTGDEYDDWIKLSKTNLYDDGSLDSRQHCMVEWNRLVMEQVSEIGLYSRHVMTQMLSRGGKLSSFIFPFVADNTKVPRILLLGDSISLGIWESFRSRFVSLKLVNIHSAPTNCGGTDQYDKHLTKWLGDCPWDLIHFNIGHHLQSWDRYEQRLGPYVEQMRAHSPQAHIVFATTTPSPFDTIETTPEREDCPNYDKLSKGGFPSKLNVLARSILEPMNVTINDRYEAILPHLKEFYKPCDIHFTRPGYNFLAEVDGKVISQLLRLDFKISS